jgi:hypothetical protein
MKDERESEWVRLGTPEKVIPNGEAEGAEDGQERFGPCEKGRERRALPLAASLFDKAVPCAVCRRICPNRQAEP